MFYLVFIFPPCECWFLYDLKLMKMKWKFIFRRAESGKAHLSVICCFIIFSSRENPRWTTTTDAARGSWNVFKAPAKRHIRMMFLNTFYVCVSFHIKWMLNHMLMKNPFSDKSLSRRKKSPVSVSWKYIRIYKTWLAKYVSRCSFFRSHSPYGIYGF